jgi:fructose-bisphosphate aldolase, class II
VDRPFSAAFAAMQRWPAEELKTPVIYGVHPVESANAGNQNMVALISSLVRSRNVVAGLHLDHSPSFDKVVEFIRDGYTSVMFEGSTLPLEQNLQLTRDVVRVARPAGVSVEAEVGTIGTTAEYGAEIENPHLPTRRAARRWGRPGSTH